MAEETPSAEELVEQLRKLQVADLLLSTMATLAQLAYVKLDADGRDFPGVKLAIESLRALLSVLEGSIPEDAARDYRQVVANLQLAYAEASG